MKRYGKYLVGVLVLVGGFFVYRYELYRYLTQEHIATWVGMFGVWGPVVYMGIYYSATLFFISAAVLTVLAGVLFGKLLGSIYVVIAATLTAQTAFMVARFLGKDTAGKLSQGKGVGTSLLEKINVHCADNGLKAFIVLRSLFLPYMPLSYAAGLVPRAKARDFFLGTLITNMIFSPAFVFFGDQIFKGPKALVFPVVIIGCVLLVPKVIKRFHTDPTKAVRDEDCEDDAEPKNI